MDNRTFTLLYCVNKSGHLWYGIFYGYNLFTTYLPQSKKMCLSLSCVTVGSTDITRERERETFSKVVEDKLWEDCGPKLFRVLLPLEDFSV